MLAHDETRIAVVWPIDDDGLVRGEDSSTGGDGFADIATRNLRSEDLGA